jgi:hypothetical protein
MSAIRRNALGNPRTGVLGMRMVLAAGFAIVGLPLIVSALGTLAVAPSITHQTFAMMQIIAGLLCLLIAVVASLMRPSARVPAEAPQPAAPPAAMPFARARDRVGMAFLIVCLAVGLIALAVRLRTAGQERDARPGVPVPASGSMPGPVRSMSPVVTPAGRSEAGRSAVKAHAPARARSPRDDDD